MVLKARGECTLRKGTTEPRHKQPAISRLLGSQQLLELINARKVIRYNKNIEEIRKKLGENEKAFPFVNNSIKQLNIFSSNKTDRFL